YNQAIEELNADTSFDYTAKITQFQGLLKIRYQPDNTALFKKIDMKQVINHLEQLKGRIQQFENQRGGNTAYLKLKNDKNQEEIQIVIEDINSKEIIRINVLSEH
ncbi:MAG TPA: hypothetical protein VK982_04965, partial [Bacteroidales bacterium]|nr:hypothetical protein [Bacteroidales bacterium]